MKPRFSILTLLGITAYFALATAASVDPTSIWNRLLYIAWFVVVIALGVEATQPRSRRSVFAGGMLFATLGYAAAASFEPSDPWLVNERINLVLKLPHHYWIAWYSQPDGFHRGATGKFNLGMRTWAIANISIAFGLLGGCLALWRYRVIERRGKEPPK